ncbi:FHA domain-containing protein [Ramlibacter sp. AW1]|uniref:FHA domain-containing protein n=1 Tax=Ramlibacter aurantiacus TaxID=2801330 RepID=A0A937D3H9_9BURK|nr:FHA domain-containing protein [Ramlibacter aurantiacus]MBL0419362.1 FHA domain-containing protein [Ramlibacter aurantiacus]
MSFFDTLARWLGLSDTAPAEGAAPPHRAAPGPAAPAVTGTSPYAALWAAIDRQLAEFMVRTVLPHRHYAPDDSFRLVRIRVVGRSPAAQRAIDDFLAEFRPESRRQVVLAAVARNCPQGVSTAAFVDLDREFDAAALEESDPFEAQLGAGAGDYQVTLFGEWAQAPAQPSRPDTGPPLELDISDADGQRRLQPTSLPLALGRAPGEGHVAGRFVSRRHGLVERGEHGEPWWRDTSANGSVVDGAPVRPGERLRLRDGARLRLGGDAGDPAECPELVLRWGGAADEDAHTPIRATLQDPPPTPLRGGLAAGASATPLAGRAPGPLCLLAIRDAQGTRTVAVTALPCVIGRADTAQVRLPEANAGVSREHLVIESLDARGAHLRNPAAGKWGTQLDGAEQPVEFVLPWGRQVVLAPRFTQAPAASVLLLEASP